MSVIVTRAPLRISLGGGGTDLPSYYERRGGYVIAGAIDKFVYIVTHTSFHSTYLMKYSELEEAEDPKDIRHPILREALVHWWKGDPLEIASVADVPSGTGLGSSSTYTVAVLKSLALARRMALPPEELAERACKLEIELLGEPIGKQDQYAAAHGGVCAYTFNPDGSVEVDPLALSPETLEDLRARLLLFFTGSVRKASSILSDQKQRTESDDPEMLANLDRVKEMGQRTRDLLEAGDMETYAELMNEHWETKRARSPTVTNEEIDRLYTLARRSGALGGKLVGAGGGGFLLVYSPRPDDTRQAMRAAGVGELQFDFEFGGCYGTEYR